MLILISIGILLVLLLLGYFHSVANETKSSDTYRVLNSKSLNSKPLNRNIAKKEQQVVVTCPKCGRSMYIFSSNINVACKYCGQKSVYL